MFHLHTSLKPDISMGVVVCVSGGLTAVDKPALKCSLPVVDTVLQHIPEA